MKKTILILLATTLITGASLAQFNSGDKFASGSTSFSGGFSSDKTHEDNYSGDAVKYSYISLNTKAGYFIQERFALGAVLNTSRSSAKSGNSKSIYNTFTVGPLARYYRGSYSGISPFAEVLAAVGTSNSKSIIPGSTHNHKSSNLQIAAGIGANYFFKDNIAFEGMLQYSLDNSKPTTDNTTHLHYTSSGLNLLFGITVYL